MAQGLRPGPLKPGVAPRATRAVRRRWEQTALGAPRLSPLGYHLTVSHAYKFMWFRVAKVGTRTILGYLDEHTTLDVRHGTNVRYPRQDLADYLAFAFVRNPLDRFVSCWRNKVVDSNHFGFEEAVLGRMQRIEEFTAWVGDRDLADMATTDRHILLQVRLVDTTRVDRLGRLETFAEDFPSICRDIGIPALPAMTRNRSVGRSVTRSDLSPHVVRHVHELYRRDFEVFGYE